MKSEHTDRKSTLLQIAPGTGKYLSLRGRLFLLFSNKIAVALTLLFLIMLLGTTGFMIFVLHKTEILENRVLERDEAVEAGMTDSLYLEQTSIMENQLAEATFTNQLLFSTYMTVISITTVGYGDAVKDFSWEYLSTDWKKAYNIWMSVFLIMAYLTILYVNANFVAYIVENKLTEVLHRRSTIKRISRFSNHFIVCGCGNTGKIVINEFLMTGVPVVGIDLDTTVSSQLKKKKGFTFLSGDALDEEVLLEAGIKKAMGLVSVLHDARSNLYLTLTAALINNDLRIVSRSVGSGSSEKLAFVGASSSVSPAITAGRRMVAELLKGETTGFLEEMLHSSGQSYRVEECIITSECGAAGKTLGNLRLKSCAGVSVFAVLKSDKQPVFNPSASYVLESNDILLVLAAPSQTLRAARIIRSGIARRRWWIFWK